MTTLLPDCLCLKSPCYFSLNLNTSTKNSSLSFSLAVFPFQLIWLCWFCHLHSVKNGLKMVGFFFFILLFFITNSQEFSCNSFQLLTVSGSFMSPVTMSVFIKIVFTPCSIREHEYPCGFLTVQETQIILLISFWNFQRCRMRDHVLS